MILRAAVQMIKYLESVDKRIVDTTELDMGWAKNRGARCYIVQRVFA